MRNLWLSRHYTFNHHPHSVLDECVMFRSRRTLTAESSRESQHKQRRRGSTAAPESSQSRCKLSAFDHSSGKPRQQGGSTQTVSKEPKVRTIREVDDDDDLNSGFASYMRSGAGRYK